MELLEFHAGHSSQGKLPGEDCGRGTPDCPSFSDRVIPTFHTSFQLRAKRFLHVTSDDRRKEEGQTE